MNNTIWTFLPAIVIMGTLIISMTMSENKRKKQGEKLKASLAVGDIVTTVGGIVGTICAVKENTVVIETGADRVRIEFIKGAISSKGTPSEQQ